MTRSNLKDRGTKRFQLQSDRSGQRYTAVKAVRPTAPIGAKSLRDAGALAPFAERRKGMLTKTSGQTHSSYRSKVPSGRWRISAVRRKAQGNAEQDTTVPALTAFRGQIKS